jgi:hypothetical protein
MNVFPPLLYIKTKLCIKQKTHFVDFKEVEVRFFCENFFFAEDLLKHLLSLVRIRWLRFADENPESRSN